MSAKTHTVVRITAKMLKGMNACQRAMKIVGPLLPLTFSTDPENNWVEALRIVSAYDKDAGISLCDCLSCRSGTYQMASDLYWLLDNSGTVSSWVYTEEEIPTVLVLQQYMAFVADALATKKGK